MDPDPTPLYRDFKDAKKKFSPIFFSYNLPTGTLSSVLKIKFFAQNFVLKPILQAFFQKREDPEPDPYL
jgi:hypothetical protein